MDDTKNLISIWFWVGLVLSVYGVIITLTGVYYLIDPAAIAGKVGNNPSLWWGIIMDAAGLVFLSLGRFGKTA